MSAKKKTKKRRKRRLIAGVLVVLLVIAGIGLSLTVFFKITDVVVEGELKMHTRQEIITASAIKTGTNLFILNARQKEKDIWIALPYIENVKIKRKLPGTVVIEVTETKNLFAVKSGGQYLVVSDNLKILDITQHVPDGTAIINGIVAVDPVKGSTLTAENAENSQFFMTLATVLDRYGLLQGVTEIDVSDKLNYSLKYENRIDVMIGTANKLDYKIQMLQELIFNKLSPDDAGFLDISTAGRATFNQADILGNSEPMDDEDSVPGGLTGDGANKTAILHSSKIKLPQDALFGVNAAICD